MTKENLVAALKKSPIVVACVVLGVGLLATLYFRLDKIPEAETLLLDKTAEADRYAANLKYSAHLKEDVDALVAANKAIDTHLIRASQLVNNAQYFYALVNETGVKLLDSRQTTPAIVPKPAKGSFVAVGFSVAVEGTLPQLIDFLQKVESGAHYSRVLTASCNVNVSKRNSPLTLTLTLELLGTP
jgi:hypothetical protein